MRKMIKRVPVPLSGVMLGVASLGNLLQSYSEGVRILCGIIAGILMVMILLKLILYPGMIKEDLKSPIMASVTGTFPMALMLLSLYIKPLIGNVSFYIWLLAIGLHGVLIIYFTVKFILKLQMPKVFASYFIVYVGIVVASMTAPAYEMTGLGSILFWFGFVTLILLLALVTYRYVKVKTVPDPAKPLICIYAAPASLCIAGYIQSIMPKSVPFLLAMYAVACCLYLFALVKAVGYLRLPFYPSYASFTFPFVISAIASKQLALCMTNLGNPLPWLSYVVLVQTVIAVLFVTYTLIRYIGFLIYAPARKSSKVTA